MARRNTLKQEFYKTTYYSYWKDGKGNPTIEYVNWLEDKILRNNNPLVITDNTKVNANLLEENERLRNFNKCLVQEVRTWDDYTDKEIEDINT